MDVPLALNYIGIRNGYWGKGKPSTFYIITGNLLWFFLILSWSLILLVMSFTKGHSSSVLSMIKKLRA